MKTESARTPMKTNPVEDTGSTQNPAEDAVNTGNLLTHPGTRHLAAVDF